MIASIKKRTSKRLPRSTPARLNRLHRLNDEDLMAQFQAGTIEAFNILVDRYSERLSYYLYRFVGDWNRVEDLLQETFLRVHRNRHSYRPIARFSTWLYTIAGNLARSDYRERKRRRTYALQLVTRDGEEYERPVPDATFFAPDRQAERALHRRHIQVALLQIPEGFREVVVLRDMQELTYEEIAAITGLPMGTVKSRIHRGRAQLQHLLADIYPLHQN